MTRRGLVVVWVCALVAAALSQAGVGCTRVGGQGVAAEAAAGGEPGDHVRKVQWGGRERTYRVHVPPGYSRDVPVPVVLNFHGGGGNAEDQQKNSQMDLVADRRGFIVAYPNGSGVLRNRFLTFNAGMCCGYAKENNIDDVGFVRAMLAELERAFAIDRRRIYATGFSNGGIMSHRLGCELSDRIAAVAAVGGPIGVDDCRPSRPVPVLHVHGTADPFAPYEGGKKKALVGGEIHEYRSAEETVAGWAKRNGCTGTAEVTLQKGSVTCTTRGRCSGGVVVTLCRITGGGHTWPGGLTTIPERRVGALNRDISASEMIWEFFSRYALP